MIYVQTALCDFWWKKRFVITIAMLYYFNFNSQGISCMQALQAFFFFEVASIVTSIVTSMLINIIFLYNNFVEEDCGKTCYVTILVIFSFLGSKLTQILHTEFFL